MSVDNSVTATRRSAYWRGTAMLIASLLLPSPVSAVVTSDAAGTHLVTPGQNAFGVNLDGVSFLALETPAELIEEFGEFLPTCTAALISDRHLIAAAHCFDPGFDELASEPDGVVDDFFRIKPYVSVFDLPDGRISLPLDLDTVQFAPGWLDLGADIAIVTLADRAPAELPRYPLYAGQEELGQKIVIVGYGETGYGATGIESEFPPVSVKRAGLNRIELIGNDIVPDVETFVYDFDSGLAENNSLHLADIPSDLGFGDDEVMVGPGDSGGPVFLASAITGISVAVTTLGVGDVPPFVEDSSWGDVALNIRVANFRDFILLATEGKAVFVPEPDPSTLAMLAGLVTLCKRTRANKPSTVPRSA